MNVYTFKFTPNVVQIVTTDNMARKARADQSQQRLIFTCSSASSGSQPVHNNVTGGENVNHESSSELSSDESSSESEVQIHNNTQFVVNDELSGPIARI